MVRQQQTKKTIEFDESSTGSFRVAGFRPILYDPEV
jgi:hypothetical protein